MKTETFYGEQVGDAPFIQNPDPIAALLSQIKRRVVTQSDLETAFADGVFKLVESMREFTLKQGIVGVTVSGMLGLHLGIPPGEHIFVMTMAGFVKVTSGG